MLIALKIFNLLHRIISYIPLGWLSFFTLFITRACIKLGKFPSYNNPDPKTLNFDIHWSILFLTLLPVFGSIVLWIPLSVIEAVTDKNLRKLDVLVYSISYICLVAIIVFDLLGLFEWFFD